MGGILKKAEAFIQKNHMISRNDGIVAGISGGADSMCLLFVLMNLKEKLNLNLCAVHVHHGIRGAEADRDETFVRDFCRDRGILYRCVRGDVPAMAKSEGMSEEEAGRAFRYRCFHQILEELGWENGRIAVAHNKNDVAETFLFNVFRGSGLTGMASIPPVRDNIIRPLLCLERREIEEVLKCQGIGFCTDSTNLKNDYTRNRLRNELMPYVLEHINPGAVEHIFNLAWEAGAVEKRVDREADQALEEAGTPDGGLMLHALGAMDDIILQAVLRKKIYRETGSLKDITRGHILQTAQLLDKPVGKMTYLPYGLTVIREYDRLRFLRRTEPEENENSAGPQWARPTDLAVFEKDIEVPFHIGETWTISLEEPAITLEFTVKKCEKNQRIEEKQYTKWLDYDKIKDSLQLRHRKSGDYLIAGPSGSRKLLRRLFIDDKIPRQDRDKVLLIAQGSHVLWVIGGRISEAYKITENTERILEIKVKGEK